MFKSIYEIRLSGRNIQIDFETWDNIRDHARNNKFFYVIYLGQKYKYVDSTPFYERPTRFNFGLVQDYEEDVIDYIYVEELKY
ncbi:MAG: hypothetical protein Q4D29_10185 [Lachnospiraceae bacterium]|nr:hypothetical protein [Lachnospiraceae bacterium]